MPILGRYMMGQIAIATTVTLTVLVFAVWMTQSLRLIEMIVENAAGLGRFIWLVALSMPEFLITVIPIAMMIAIIFSYDRMLADGEIAAMRAAGASQWRLARPALVVGIVLCGLTFLITLYLWPIANREFRELRALVRSEFSTALLRQGRFNTIDDGIMVYFEDRASSGEVRGLLLHDERDPDASVTVIAQSGVVLVDDGHPVILVRNGVRQERIRSTGVFQELSFDQYSIRLDLGEEVRSTWRQHDERFLPDLLYPDMSHPADRAAATRLIAEGHRRLATPLTVIALALLTAALILSGQSARTRGVPLRIAAIAGVGVGFEAVFLGLIGTATRDHSLIVGLYAVPAGACLLGLFLLGGGDQLIGRTLHRSGPARIAPRMPPLKPGLPADQVWPPAPPERPASGPARPPLR